MTQITPAKLRQAMDSDTLGQMDVWDVRLDQGESTNKQLQTLVEVLTSGKCSNRLTVDICSISLEEEDTTILAQALTRSKRPSYLTLKFRFIHMPSNCTRVLANALQSTSYSPNLTLVFSDTNPGPGGIEAIANALPKFPSNLTLDLRHAMHNKQKIQALMSALTSRKNAHNPYGLTLVLNQQYIVDADRFDVIITALSSEKCPQKLTLKFAIDDLKSVIANLYELYNRVPAIYHSAVKLSCHAPANVMSKVLVEHFTAMCTELNSLKTFSEKDAVIFQRFFYVLKLIIDGSSPESCYTLVCTVHQKFLEYFDISQAKTQHIAVHMILRQWENIVHQLHAFNGFSTYKRDKLEVAFPSLYTSAFLHSIKQTSTMVLEPYCKLTNHITEAQLKGAVEAIQFAQQYRPIRICFSNTQPLEARQLKIITDALQSKSRPSHITLDLSHCHIDSEKIAVLAELLHSEHCPEQLSICLDGCWLNEENIQQLANIIKSGKCRPHLQLSLANSNLSLNSIATLADMLTDKNCPQHLVLDLSGNDYLIYSHPGECNGVTYLARTLTNENCPQYLTLRLKRLPRRTIKTIFSLSPLNLALQSRECASNLTLDLSENELFYEESRNIALALQSCHVALTMKLDMPKKSNSCRALASNLKNNLGHLALHLRRTSDYAITNHSKNLQYFLDALSSGSCADDLTIQLPLQAGDMNAVVKAITNENCPQYLTLDLTGNSLSLEDTGIVAEILLAESTPSHLTMNLTDTNIDTQGLRTILTALQSERCVDKHYTVILNEKHFGSPEACEIADFLKAGQFPQNLVLEFDGGCFEPSDYKLILDQIVALYNNNQYIRIRNSYCANILVEWLQKKIQLIHQQQSVCSEEAFNYCAWIILTGDTDTLQAIHQIIYNTIHSGYVTSEISDMRHLSKAVSLLETWNKFIQYTEKTGFDTTELQQQLVAIYETLALSLITSAQEKKYLPLMACKYLLLEHAVSIDGNNARLQFLLSQAKRTFACWTRDETDALSATNDDAPEVTFAGKALLRQAQRALFPHKQPLFEVLLRGHGFLTSHYIGEEYLLTAPDPENHEPKKMFSLT